MFVVLVTGPPGSGKTTTLTALLDALAEHEVPETERTESWMRSLEGALRGRTS